MSLTDEIYRIADELRGVASTGLRFAKDHHDVSNFQHVLSASARLIAALEQRSADEVMSQYEDNLSHISPLMAASAAVFRDGRLLLQKREDNGLWGLPGGLVEVGETLAEAAQRELWEETNVRGRVSKLLGIFDSRVWRTTSKSHMYHFVFLVDAEDSSVPAAGPETTDVGFFSEEDLPPLTPGAHKRVPFIFKQMRGEAPVPYFDPVDEVAKPAGQH